MTTTTPSGSVEFTAWCDATCETAPSHLWLHAVESEVARRGGDCAILRESEWAARLMLWYRSGEPVWMATDSATVVAKETARARANDVGSHLRGVLAACARALGDEK